MKRSRALPWIIALAPVLAGQAPAGPRPLGQAQAPAADPGKVQCLRYLRAYRFAETARGRFLEAVSAAPGSARYQECFQCIADQFTNENLEPRFREVLLSFMTLDELSRMNDFLESPLGRKLIQVAMEGGDEARFRAAMDRKDLAELERVMKEPFYRAAAAFNERGLPRISGGDVAKAYLMEFREKCGRFPHPW